MIETVMITGRIVFESISVLNWFASAVRPEGKYVLIFNKLPTIEMTYTVPIVIKPVAIGFLMNVPYAKISDKTKIIKSPSNKADLMTARKLISYPKIKPE